MQECKKIFRESCLYKLGSQVTFLLTLTVLPCFEEEGTTNSWKDAVFCTVHFAVMVTTQIPQLVRLQASRIIKAVNDFGRSLAQPPIQSRASCDLAMMIMASSSWVLKLLNDGGKIYYKATFRPSLLDSVATKTYKTQTRTLQYCKGRRCTRLIKESWSVCLVGFWPNWALHECGQGS